MKQKFLLLLLVAAAAFTFCGCSKEDDNDKNQKDDKENTESNQPKNYLLDYVGVWEDVDNPLFFLAISSEGKVNYCFSTLLSR